MPDSTQIPTAPTPNPTHPPTTRRSCRRRAARLLLLLIIIAAVIAALLWRRAQSDSIYAGMRLPINDEISLQLVDILTADSDIYYMTGWRGRSMAFLLEKMPSAWRTKVPQRYKELAWHRVDPPESSGAIVPIFEIAYPAEWKDSYTPADIERKIKQADELGTSDYLLSCNTPEGWSSNLYLYYIGDSIERHGNRIYLVDTYSINELFVPRNRNQLTMRLSKHDRYHLPGSFEFTNPAYEDVAPLPDADLTSGPITHADVSVTLKVFIAQADHTVWSELLGADISADDKLQPDNYPRAEGGALDSFHTYAVFEIDHATRPDTQYTIRTFAASYGTKEFTLANSSSAQVLHRGRQVYVKLPYDVSVLEQPVKMDLEIMKVNDWAPDETTTLDFPLLADASTTRTERTTRLWDGPAGVAVQYDASESDVPATGIPGHVPARSVLFYQYGGSERPVGSPMDNVLIKNIRFTGADNQQVSFAPDDLEFTYDELILSTRGKSQWKYILHYLPYTDVLKKARKHRAALEGNTTVSVTIASARPHPGKYTFIARPTEATGTRAEATTRRVMRGIFEGIFGE